jgi:hypothetical protein
MEDAKGTVRVVPRQEGPVVVLRPEVPFDWRHVSDARFRCAHRECDLSASPDPLVEFRSWPDRALSAYNLFRTLA